LLIIDFSFTIYILVLCIYSSSLYYVIYLFTHLLYYSTIITVYSPKGQDTSDIGVHIIEEKSHEEKKQEKRGGRRRREKGRGQVL